jgi:hypothetical protein
VIHARPSIGPARMWHLREFGGNDVAMNVDDLHGVASSVTEER